LQTALTLNHIYNQAIVFTLNHFYHQAVPKATASLVALTFNHFYNRAIA
jgi:hypothetical protein